MENKRNYVRNELELSLSVLNSLEESFGGVEEVCNELPLTVKHLVDKYVRFEKLSKIYEMDIEINHYKIKEYKKFLPGIITGLQKESGKEAKE